MITNVDTSALVFLDSLLSLFRLLSESLFLFPDGTTAVENVRSAGALQLQKVNYQLLHQLTTYKYNDPNSKLNIKWKLAGMVGYWDTGFSSTMSS